MGNTKTWYITTIGKRVLNKEFDIGKSIVVQGASLKAKVAEHTIDAAIEESDNKKDEKK